MIDFACKRFQLDEVIKCGLSLSKADYRVFDFLIGHDEDVYSTEELAKELGLNLSTIQRAVKKLYEKHLLKRFQTNLDGGGYSFQYAAKDKSHIKEIIMGIVNRWSSTVENALKDW